MVSVLYIETNTESRVEYLDLSVETMNEYPVLSGLLALTRLSGN